MHINVHHIFIRLTVLMAEKLDTTYLILYSAHKIDTKLIFSGFSLAGSPSIQLTETAENIQIRVGFNTKQKYERITRQNVFFQINIFL